MANHCLDKCAACGKQLNYGHKTNLCIECYRKSQKLKRILVWLDTGDTGCAVSTTLRGVIRDFVYIAQDGKCAICGQENQWNGKPLHFVMDHIDGDASNSQYENLRLICPNCDSQLPTFKSKNKNSARKFRRICYTEPENSDSNKAHLNNGGDI